MASKASHFRVAVFLISLIASIPFISAVDDCHENCDCNGLTVSCVRGKVPLGTKEKGFGTYFAAAVTKMHIDNSDSETSLEDKTRLNPLTSDALTYENVIELTLKGVYIEVIADNAFQFLVGLTHLYLDDNKIETLSAKTFSGLRQLQTLSMNNNKLNTVPSGSFEPLVSIVNLHLQGNRIDGIQAGAFPKNPLIEVLDISKNPELRAIPTAVDSLSALDKLIARDCKINELRDNLKAKFPGIIEIDLTNNLIPEIRPSHFSELHELKKLHLGENRIVSLDSQLFPGLIITDVNISHNEITSIHPDAILSAQITNLDLSNNPVGPEVWETGIFDHADIRWEIRKLFLSHVNLESIGELFRGIKRLNILDLAGNRLRAVSKRELQDFAPSLLELNLDNNHLTSITDAFDEMKQLQRLSLAGNKLNHYDEGGKVTFPDTLMDNLDRLVSLDISNNSFAYIPEKLAVAFQRRNHLRIGLKHNPYFCDYRVKPLNQYLKLPTQSGRCPSEIREGIAYEDVSKVSPKCLKCVGPPERKGKYLIQLSAAEMRTPPPEPDDPLGTGGIVAILVALIVVLVVISVVLILLKRRQEKRRAQEMAGNPQFEDGDYDDYVDDSFDESKSTFSAAQKSVAHESNI